MGVGVGPGDPKLLTVRAVEVLSSASVVAYPYSSDASSSRALSAARPYLRDGARLLPLRFPMSRDRSEQERAWDEACDEVASVLEGGESLAFVVLGDPAFYSTYSYLARKVRERGFRVETIPGVSSFSLLSALLGEPLAEEGESALICPLLDGQVLEEALGFDCAVLMKPAERGFSRLKELLRERGLLDRVVGAFRLCEESQRLVFGEDLLGEELDYMSLFVYRRRGFPWARSTS